MMAPARPFDAALHSYKDRADGARARGAPAAGEAFAGGGGCSVAADGVVPPPQLRGIRQVRVHAHLAGAARRDGHACSYMQVRLSTSWSSLEDSAVPICYGKGRVAPFANWAVATLLQCRPSQFWLATSWLIMSACTRRLSTSLANSRDWAPSKSVARQEEMAIMGASTATASSAAPCSSASRPHSVTRTVFALRCSQRTQ